jgi:hypothetical protein
VRGTGYSNRCPHAADGRQQMRPIGWLLAAGPSVTAMQQTQLATYVGRTGISRPPCPPAVAVVAQAVPARPACAHSVSCRSVRAAAARSCCRGGAPRAE